MLDLDPFSMPTLNNIALMRNLEGRFEQAREIARQMAAQSSRMLTPQQLIAGTYVEEGRPHLLFRFFGISNTVSRGRSFLRPWHMPRRANARKLCV